MRTWLVAVLFLVVSIGTNAAAQQDVPLPDPAPTGNDALLVYFRLGYGRMQRPTCDDLNDDGTKSILFLDHDIDLSSDNIAQEIIRLGTVFGLAQCPNNDSFTIRLANNQYGTEFAFQTLAWGKWRKDQPKLIVGYRNLAAEELLQKEGEARKAIRQQQAQEQARQRQQAETAAFYKRNGVKRVVTMEELAANPFVFKGQVVAVYCFFSEMSSATQAMFYSGNNLLAVSGAPPTRFKNKGAAIMVVGRVLGKTEVKMPFGAMSIAHLSFVGSAACQDFACDEYRR